ncbi:hypothetical protein ASE00_12465 [Sphingomonas sp. Root710]|uniref:DUF4118 domain-containing protein n=1 Tax=Sphingomonas sp. Root710 TaxID=1736594 RepID=UPI0006F3CBCB|nr:DUF4118 domain-containing protein [Sphingomonas sp. Root710]KRB82826.1 hypothetical protein ASE00_12465 [Sphingomonas sp. Root710]
MALSLVGAGFATRSALDPVFRHNSFVFSIFYLTVVLAAFFCGSGPAIVASILSALLAYWAFADPVYSMKLNVEALTGMAFFALTCAIDIYFIMGMQRAVQKYRLEHLRAEGLAEGNAILFKELNERTTHHLQLVSALLQARAGEGGDAVYRTALAEASRRTMGIVRAHRAIADEAIAPIDFAGFARQLIQASIETSGQRARPVTISGDRVMFGAEQATSTGVILLEWLGAVAASPPRDMLAPIDLRIDSDELCCTMTLTAQMGHVASGIDDISRQLMNAAVEQMNGRFSWHSEGANVTFSLSVPLAPPVGDLATPIDPPSTLLH